MSRAYKNAITFSLLLSLLLALCPETAGQTARAEAESLRIPYRKGDKWGLVDRHRNIIVRARYDEMDLGLYHADDWIRVRVGGRPANPRGARAGEVEGGRWGFINGRGEAITPIKYDALMGSRPDRFPWFQRQGKWGVLDRRGREILPARFDSDKLFSATSLAEDGVKFVEDIIWNRRASGNGGELYNSLGQAIKIPLRADESFGWDDAVMGFLGSGGGVVGCGILNAEKTEVTRLRYNYCNGFRNGFAIVYAYDADGKQRHGFIDARGREVVPLRYDEIDSSSFDDGFARVANDSRWGLINRSGVELTPLKYRSIEYFREGLALVKLGDKVGYINTEGREVIPLHLQYPPYDSQTGNFITQPNEGARLLIAKLNDKLGILDMTGRVKVPFLYDAFHLEGHYGPFISVTRRGAVWAKRDGKYALVSLEGKELIAPTYDNVKVIRSNITNADFEPVFAVHIYGKGEGLVNQDGREMIPPRDTWIGDSMVNGQMRFRLKEKMGILDVQGRVVITPLYDSVEYFSDGLVLVKREGKYGYVNASNEVVVALRYETAGGFRQGAAIVGAQGKFGLIDKSGKELIPIKYDRVEHAGSPSVNQENLTRYRITLGDKCGYLDERGRELTPLKYEYFGALSLTTERDTSWHFEEGVACVKRNGKYGLIDCYGKEIVPPKYDEPIVFAHRTQGFTLVSLRGRPGFLDKTGVEYFEQ